MSSIFLNILAKDNEIIPYRKELNSITGSVTATILLQQVIYWHIKNNNEPFYKFIEPCSHEKYNEGDSWVEELGFSRKEYLTAMKKLTDKKLVSKKTNMSRLTYYFLNLGDLDKALKGIYINAERGFTKMPNGDLDNKETENTTENTQREKNTKKSSTIPADIINFYKSNISNQQGKIKEIKSTNALALIKDSLDEVLIGLQNYANDLPANEMYIISLLNFIQDKIFIDYKLPRNTNQTNQDKTTDLVNQVFNENKEEIYEGEIIDE